MLVSVYKCKSISNNNAGNNVASEAELGYGICRD